MRNSASGMAPGGKKSDYSRMVGNPYLTGSGKSCTSYGHDVLTTRQSFKRIALSTVEMIASALLIVAYLSIQSTTELSRFALRIINAHNFVRFRERNGMTTGTIDESQRKAARVAGFFYLLTFAIVVAVNFGINERLMVNGDPAQTARNILAHERLFRIGIASNLVYEAGLLTLLSALYVTLRPAGRTLALLAAFWRLVYASMWVLMSLNQLTALRLLNGADYLRVLGTEQAQTLGRLYRF
ncbi:MAG: hypothetical protein DMG97_39200 [Acidobacteria bacterium]|nr:MAG: hypothetical protein DMG97_39200 [Acidobacteriota bacterium]